MVKIKKTINSFFIFFWIIFFFLLIKIFIKPIKRTAELNISAWGIKKLEVYEMSIRIKIP